MASRQVRILILCKTYPSPSGKHVETSCVAGMEENGHLSPNVHDCLYACTLEASDKLPNGQSLIAESEDAICHRWSIIL
jgi:hypothetical protein